MSRLRRLQIDRLSPSTFRILAVVFWALTTARLVSLATAPGLRVGHLSVWAVSAGGYVIGLVFWAIPWTKLPLEQIAGAIVIGLALPLLYLTIRGNVRPQDLLALYITLAVLTAAVLPLRTAMAAALLGAVAAAIPLIAGWTAYYDRALLVLVSVIGLLTYVQARMMGTLGQEKRRAEGQRRELEESYLATISALAATIYGKDREVEAHSRGTSALAVAVGRRLKLDAEQLRLLQYATLLHDIGKAGLPGYVLYKPGRLTADEAALMKEHPVIAERILKTVPSLRPVAPIVRAQNEQWDGTGYPDNLKGPAIPQAARILHCCSAYHAMASDRPYRQALTDEEIRRELESQAGKQFDPAVVRALLDVIEAGEVELLGSTKNALVNNARSWQQQLETIQALGSNLSSEQGVPQICQLLADATVWLIPNDQSRVYLVDDENHRLRPIFVSKSEREEYAGVTLESHEVRWGEGVTGWVAKSKRGVVLDDAARDYRAAFIPDTPRVKESMLAAPLVYREKVLGVVTVVALGVGRFNRDHLRVLTILANQAAANLAYARLLQRLYQAAA